MRRSSPKGSGSSDAALSPAVASSSSWPPVGARPDSSPSVPFGSSSSASSNSGYLCPTPRKGKSSYRRQLRPSSLALLVPRATTEASCGKSTFCTPLHSSLKRGRCSAIRHAHTVAKIIVRIACRGAGFSPGCGHAEDVHPLRVFYLFGALGKNSLIRPPPQPLALFLALGARGPLLFLYGLVDPHDQGG